MNKKRCGMLIVLLLVSVLSCSACKKPIVSNMELLYGLSYRITDDRINEKPELVWTSTDPNIASITNGSIKAINPGSVTLTATDHGKTFAEYHIVVKTIPATSIIFSTNSCEIAEEESFKLGYSLIPSDASLYGLEWRSADDKVAKVDQEGNIEGVAAGQTTISLSNKEGVVATCSVTVKKKLPNFIEMFPELAEKDKDATWVEISNDGTWMSFDTNPSDNEYSRAPIVHDYLPVVLSDLGYSSSVYEKMLSTNALMGKQDAVSDTTTVSWTYHPDNGLEVMFEVKQ